jgi:O-antigen/teichoic acid export membrane protein
VTEGAAIVAAAGTGSTRRNLRRVLGSSTLYATVTLATNLAVIPFLLRSLSLQRYGEWATLAAVLAVAQLADGGVSTDIARRVAGAEGRGDPHEAQRAVREGLTVLTVVALLIACVAWATATPVLAALFPGVGGQELATLHAVYGSVVALMSVGLIMSGWLAALGGLQRSDYAAWGGLSGLILGTGITVACAMHGFGLWSLLAGTAVQSVSCWALPALGLRRLRPGMKLRFARIGLRTALAYVRMPAMIVAASLSNVFAYQFDKLVLSHYRGPAATGLYQIGLNVVLQLQVLSLLPMGILLASTAELHTTQSGKLRRIERLATSATLAAGATFVGGLEVYGPSFFRLWLGPGYETVAYVTRLLGLAVLIGLVAAPWYYYAVGRGLYRYILIGGGTNVVVNATCAIFLTARIGITGALLGSLSGNLIATAVAWSILRRREKRPWILPAVRPFVAVGTAAGVAFGLSRVLPSSSWPQLIAGSASYLCLVCICLVVANAVPVRIRRWRWAAMPAFDEGALA